MTIKDALDYATQVFLANPQILKARFEAEILLGNVLEKERVFLHAHSQEKLDLSQKEAFFALVDRRAQNEPIEYLTNSVSFFSEIFYVDSGVLIPRPESEILVEKVCEIVQKQNLKHIAEIGVGSGVLSISVARACKEVYITASDISAQALAVAKKNIALFGLQSRINLVQTSLLDNAKPSPKISIKSNPKSSQKSSVDFSLDSSADFELVFSNPPYIANDYILPPNLAYEPKEALFGGEKGSEILESIIKICAKREIKILACEIGYNLAQILAPMLRENGYEAEFYDDLNGLKRGFIARLRH
ncbi:N5-glutamine methyltransferase family protein [Helicobacter sp. T3_23-1059]